MHHQDLTPGVLAGLAWYYLLAAMLNAAAAAYVSYGEMVSEGASRVGLAPKTRRLPTWLITAFFALYGLAILMILGRQHLPGAVRRAYGLCALANALLAVMAGADAAHFAELKAHGHGEGDPTGPPSLDDHQPAVGLGKPINRTLWTLIWGVAAVIFQAIGVSYILGGADRPAPIRPRRHRLRRRPHHVLRRCDARLHRRDPLAAVRRQRTGRLVDRQPVPALLRLEHDRLRLPRHRHQARQRADRRPADPGRLLLLVRPAAGRDQRRPDRPRLAHPRRARAGQDPDLARPGLHRADLHGDPDDRPGRLGNRAPGAAGAAGQLDRGPQPVEGPVVLPRPPGDARLLRPLDGRRRAAEHDHRRADGDPLHRHQQGRQRLLHLQTSASSPSSRSSTASSCSGWS